MFERSNNKTNEDLYFCRVTFFVQRNISRNISITTLKVLAIDKTHQQSTLCKVMTSQIQDNFLGTFFIPQSNPSH